MIITFQIVIIFKISGCIRGIYDNFDRKLPIKNVFNRKLGKYRLICVGQPKHKTNNNKKSVTYLIIRSI